MRRLFISAIDIAAFMVFGTLFAGAVLAIMAVGSLFRRNHQAAGEINRFSFVIFNPESAEYPSMEEETLLGGYLSKDFLLYLDFSKDKDFRKEIVPGKVFFYSVAAHPRNALYGSGFRRVSSLLVELNILWTAFTIVRRSRISFIKSHDPHLLGLNGLIISRVFHLPAILHMNSDFDEKYRGTGKTSSPIFYSRFIERLFELFMISSYDVIMADREFYKKSRNFPVSAISRYVSVGVRVDRKHYSDLSLRRDLRRDMGLAAAAKIVLYVGRLHPVKYTEDVIKAMALIKEDVKDAVLLLVGTGMLEDKLKEMVRQYGIADSVLFLGSKSHDELMDIFYTADVLLTPHGGVTLVESALSSTPIVAYDFDWHSEFVEDGAMGHLVSFRDFHALAKKTVSLLQDENLREKMGSYCRKKATGMYSRDRSLENEKKVYSRIIQR